MSLGFTSGGFRFPFREPQSGPPPGQLHDKHDTRNRLPRAFSHPEYHFRNSAISSVVAIPLLKFHAVRMPAGRRPPILPASRGNPLGRGPPEYCISLRRNGIPPLSPLSPPRPRGWNGRAPDRAWHGT
jgi:hypothetical protein